MLSYLMQYKSATQQSSIVAKEIGPLFVTAFLKRRKTIGEQKI